MPERRLAVALAIALLPGLAAPTRGAGIPGPDTVTVPEGRLRLRAVLWRPAGPGRFPAVLFAHGSGHAPGTAAARTDQRHPEIVGPAFVRHGYVLLYLYRRGDALSAGQGVPSGDLLDRALATRGQAARNRLQLRLLAEETSDVEAGLGYLRRLPEVDPRRLALVGHSFGGSLVLLAAERDTTPRAIVTFGLGARSWERSPELRQRLLAAARRVTAPVLLVHAANDYGVEASRGVAAEMTRLGRSARVAIYPPVGTTPAEGHAFVYLGIDSWESDVFAFLDAGVAR